MAERALAIIAIVACAGITLLAADLLSGGRIGAALTRYRPVTDEQLHDLIDAAGAA